MGRVILVVLLSMGLGQSAFADFGVASRQVTRTISQNISKNLFERMVPKLKVKNSSGKVTQMNVSATGKYLTLSLEDETARVWDLEYGVQRPFVKRNTKILAHDIDESQGLFYILQESMVLKRLRIIIKSTLQNNF
jgi:WD40 repeat protein